ncbi:MAG: Sir2 family NAD+-dependent deacetylase [Pseudomonadota bacterium]
MNYASIVILTGAGISAESGLKTFRAADGLWEDHRVEDVATPEAFIRDPALVHRFYNERRRYLLSGIEPNAAHHALAKLSASNKPQVTLITQNIDDLHRRAGSHHIYHMHGELLKIRCKVTGQTFDCNHDTSVNDSCACCKVAGNLRPHVVWFGEMPLYMNEIEMALRNCDLFVAIGTSGNVYPAAGFFQTAKFYGAHTVELNLEPSTSGSLFDEQHYGPATDIVPNFFSGITD